MQDLRQRTGTLVAASGIITGLFGQRVLDDPDGAPAWTAIGLAILLLAVGLWNCLAILTPVKDRGDVRDVPDQEDRRTRPLAPYLRLKRDREWKMGLEEREYQEIARRARHDATQASQDDGPDVNTEAQLVSYLETNLARELERARRLNNWTIDRRSRWFELAGILLFAQVALWIVAVAVE